MKSLTVSARTLKTLPAKLAYWIALAVPLSSVPLHLALAQVAPTLGTAQSFAVLGASTVTNTGPTVVTGDLGVSPGTAITGFPPGLVIGATHSADAVASEAQSDTTAAYVNLAGQACNTTYSVPTDLGGLTLVPGVYCFLSSAALTGTLTLNGGGDPNAVWIFQIASTLITASNASVLVENGAQNCNVFWQVGSSATLGTGTNFIGNILALASITLTTDATLSGRALAQNGAVTMDSNTVAVSACALRTIPPMPPTVSKAFSPATVPAGAGSTLTLTLSNANATAATLSSSLTDTLPTGVVVSGTATTSCGGTLATTSGSVTMSGGAIPANGSCTITVPVTAANGGVYINALPIGALQTSNGSNAAPAVATLTVPQPATAPTLGKAFSPATIDAGGSSTLTLTLSNSDSAAATMTAPLTDTLPTGVTVSGTATSTCGGTLTSTSGSVTLAGGSIPASSSCSVTIPVSAANGGNFINSLAAGALQTSNGANAAPAVATLSVVAPASVVPTLGKAFSPAVIAAGGTSTLTLTLSNASGTAANLTAPLTDNLPSGLLVSGTPTTSCGGSVASTSSSVTQTGGSIPADGSCVITITVSAAAGGSYINTLPAGALQTSNGNSAYPVIATLTVSTPSVVSLGKSFSPATISAGGTSTLTLALSNSGGTAAELIAALVDKLPSGVVTSGAASNTCGGTVVISTLDDESRGGSGGTKSGSTVTLTGGSIPADSSCTVTVQVVAAVAGSYFNAVPAGALQTNQGNNAAPALATLTVNAKPNVSPSLGKTFNPSTVLAGGVSTLTITLSNPIGAIAKLTEPLVDNLTSGLAISGTPSTTCGGTVTTGTWTETARGGGGNDTGAKVTLTGGSIPANGSCTVTIEVSAKATGSYCNMLDMGALQTNQGKNAASASAILTVYSLPTLKENFSPATVAKNAKSVLNIILSNGSHGSATITAPFIDHLPSGLVIAGYASTTCGGTLTAVTGSSVVTLNGGEIQGGSTCSVSLDVKASVAGSYVNTLPAGVLQTSDGSNAASASATLTVTN
jgi:uncharacterized repeat protein (TIGR01451 family)